MNDLLAVRSKTAMSLGFHIVVFKGGKVHMLERDTIRRAMQEKRTSKKPTTQAGEFAREEMHHIREGKHGARSTKQAIAIGCRRLAEPESSVGLLQKVKRLRAGDPMLKWIIAKARRVANRKRLRDGHAQPWAH